MSDKDANKGNESLGERGYRDPGLRSVRTTTLFRAVNPELFIKPVRILVYTAPVTYTFSLNSWTQSQSFFFVVVL